MRFGGGMWSTLDHAWSMSYRFWLIDMDIYLYICTYMHIYIYWLTNLLKHTLSRCNMADGRHATLAEKISSEVWHQKGQILGIYLGMYLVDIHVYQRISMGYQWDISAYSRWYGYIYIYVSFFLVPYIYMYVCMYVYGKSTWTRDSSH